MRMEYVFNVLTSELLYTTEYRGTRIIRTNYHDELYIDRTAIFVSEGEDAEREMFNHFGDDSSWPPGWWERMGSPQVKRATTWQEYFGVHCPNREPFNIPTPPESTLGFFTRESWRKENYS